MIETVRRQLRCPLCRTAFVPRPGALVCANGHAFDLARQGYANLLTGRTPASADTPAMVAARAALLAEGHLEPVTAAIVVATSGCSDEAFVVDAGAGTGH